MFPNWKAEMTRQEITHKQVAEVLGKSSEWLETRLQGKASLPITDAIKIKTTFFPTMSYEYLYSYEPILPQNIEDIKN